MRILVPTLFFLCILSSANGQVLPPAGERPEFEKRSVDLLDHPVRTGRVEVFFTRKMRFNDLVKIKLDMADQGIFLDYQSLEFDAQGELSSIRFFVNSLDGFSGGASSNSLTNKNTFGFFRDYGNAANPFGAGAIGTK
jgi:hypothetical protein